jgi:hypothetical protein
MRFILKLLAINKKFHIFGEIKLKLNPETMKRSLFILSLLGLLAAFTSCNPVVNTNIAKYQAPLPANSEIKVISAQQELPDNAEFIGTVDVDESGFTTRCDYEYVLELAKHAAKTSGADLIQIVEHKTPNVWSTCHRIKAGMYTSIGDGPLPSNPDSTLATSPGQVPKSSDYFADDKGSNAKGTPSEEVFLNILNQDDKKVRIAIHAGFSRRLSPLPDGLSPDEETYLNKLRNGYHIGADIGFNVGSNNYLGPRWDRYSANNSIDALVFLDDGSNVTGELSETITINFFGLQWLTRQVISNSGSAFWLSVAAGYMGYTSAGTGPFQTSPLEVSFQDFSATGGNFAARLDGGVDIAIGENVSLGFGLGFGRATINKLDLTVGGSTNTVKLDEDSGEGLFRLDVSTGLRWNF